MSEEMAAIVIPTAASIIVFILGYIINEIIDLCKEDSRKATARKSVLVWIDIVLDPLNKDITSVRKFAADCVDNKSIQQPVLNWLPLLGEKLEDVIDRQAIYAFLDDNPNGNQQSVFHLVTQSRFLTEIEKNIREHYDRYRADSKDLAEEWNRLYIDVTDRISNLVNHILMPNDPLGRFLVDTMKKHQEVCKANPNNFAQAYESLIPALMGSAYSSRPEFVQIEQLAFMAEKIHRQWLAYNVGYGQLFNGIADSLFQSFDILKQSYTKLNK